MESNDVSGQWLERITLSVSSFLEQHRGVSNVQMFDRPSAQPDDLEAWQSRNAPVTLPDDLKNFYAITNGMLLRWKMQYNGKQVSIFATMHLIH
jgi:hypothetical protein